MTSNYQQQATGISSSDTLFQVRNIEVMISWENDHTGKFHQSFAADLTIRLLLSLNLRLSIQKVGDHGGTVSLNRVSNSAA